MKPLISLLVLICLTVSSCKNTGGPVVDTRFTDSLMSNYGESVTEKLVRGDLDFWKNRVDSAPGSFTPLSRYAGALVHHFQLYGDMTDLLKADSVLGSLNREYKETEAGILRSLASLQITRHRFRDADQYVQKALALGSEKYSSTLLYFDTQFELGNYTLASQALQTCAATNQYGYFFRLSKWKHWQGETDSAVFYMQKAAEWSGNSLVLKQTTLSNIGDLYMHEGELRKAGDLYMVNLKHNAADYHSLQGLGRIALLKDEDPFTAEKIFRFIASKNQLPDAMYNLVWVAEQKADTLLQKKYADEFVHKATDSMYGGMYNKYIIELYTGILQSPQKAVILAEKELLNRNTPQTYAWYAWALYKAGQEASAMKIYKTHISGKPLEALELYWIGKMMKGPPIKISMMYLPPNKKT
jgi:hypothetical protein